MKTKILLIFIILITLLILLMSGYFVYKTILNDNKEVTVKKNDKIEDDTIKEDISKDYVYKANYKTKDSVKNYQVSIIDEPNHLLQGKISIEVPYININTKDGVKVNKEIKSLYQQTIKNIDKIILCEKNTPSQCQKMFLNYVTYQSNNYLSVIIAVNAYETAVEHTIYYGYVFDLKDGHLLSSNEIAKINNMSLMELEVKTKNAIEAFAIQNNQTSQLDMTYTKLHTAISNQGIVSLNDDGIIYYMDNTEKLHVLVNINVDTEIGKYTYLLDVN